MDEEVIHLFPCRKLHGKLLVIAFFDPCQPVEIGLVFRPGRTAENEPECVEILVNIHQDIVCSPVPAGNGIGDFRNI